MPGDMRPAHTGQQPQQLAPPFSELDQDRGMPGTVHAQVGQARSPKAPTGRSRQQRSPHSGSRSPSARQHQQRGYERAEQASNSTHCSGGPVHQVTS